MTPHEQALLMIQAVRSELLAGTRHYNKDGKLLETEREILQCMVDEGGVVLEPTEERKQVFNELLLKHGRV
jgi:hypothetical protein